MAQRILHHNAYTGKLAIGELLIRCQRMIASGSVRRADTPFWVVVLQAIKAGITDDSHLLWDLLNHLRLHHVFQIVPGPRGGGGYLPNPPSLVDDDSRLAGVGFLLPRIVTSLTLIVAGTLDALLRGIHDGQQVRIVPQR